jgi:hypothetical protein
MLPNTALLAVGLLYLGITSADPRVFNKPFLRPPFNENRDNPPHDLETKLRKALSPKAFTKSRWTNTALIPEHCRNLAYDWNVPRTELEIYNVTYTDCAQPWVMCRWMSHSQSADEILGVSNYIEGSSSLAANH